MAKIILTSKERKAKYQAKYDYLKEILKA